MERDEIMANVQFLSINYAAMQETGFEKIKKTPNKTSKLCHKRKTHCNRSVAYQVTIIKSH